MKETQSFSAEELESYNAPIVFLGSSDGRYFITLDNPDERYNLDFKQIWDSEIESVYYYSDENTISFLYDDYLFLYNINEEKLIYSKQLVLQQWEEIYGWITPQTLIMGAVDITYELDINSDKRTEINDLGLGIILTDDKTMGCSVGDENWFGVVFSPVLVWDTKEYKVKRFGEGAMSGNRVQLSNDKKYVMFVRLHSSEPNQILCLNMEEETM